MEVMNMSPPSAIPALSKARHRSNLIDELDDNIEFKLNYRPHDYPTIDDSIAEVDEDNLDDVCQPAPAPKPQRSGSLASNKSSDLAKAKMLRKAKRAGRDRAYSTSEDGKFGGCPTAAGAIHHQKLNNKNSRKSRNGLGRGLPKKGGAGGKGTWGKAGCELDAPSSLDANDPNYVSDEDEEELLQKTKTKMISPAGVTSTITPHSGHTALKTLVPEMSQEDLIKAVEPLVLEYFENNDSMEVIYSLQEIMMNFGSLRWMVVTILIEHAIDHKPSHREMASVLISELYLKVVSQRDIGKAFDHLLNQLPDLILDTPDAPEVLGNFLARAIADDCIPPKFLHSYKGHVETPEAKAALRKADTLLSMKHGMVRLDNVWGVGGGIRPVKYLIKKINLLLKEYLCSGDIKEATRCLQDLEVPHFHHEMVYEAVVIVIESMHEKTEESMCKLLQSLFRSFVITIDQMRNGFERVYEIMPDIALDVPAAYAILERFVTRCRKANIMTEELARKMPQRGRKRFVSEGDGGLVKDSSNFW